MRYLVAFMLISSAAMADDVDALKERFYENHAACRMGEFNGKPISQADSDKACGQLDRLAVVLKKAHQCWDKSELVWSPCK
jgi:hypothetical protein